MPFPREAVEFAVPFVRGKARPRFSCRGHAYTPAETRNAERAVLAAFLHETGRREGDPPLFAAGPVAVEVAVFMPLPKRVPKREESRPYTVKPDADNVAKLVLDALNGHAWRDDSQVVDLHIVKMPRTRGLEPETRVLVAPLGREERFQ